MQIYRYSLILSTLSKAYPHFHLFWSQVRPAVLKQSNPRPNIHYTFELVDEIIIPILCCLRLSLIYITENFCIYITTFAFPRPMKICTERNKPNGKPVSRAQ